jgi:hypothetical protein
MLKRIAVALLFVALLCGFAGCSGCGPESNPPESHAEDIRQATAAIDSWLKLIDQANYSGAYDQTGSQFKKTIGKDDWVKQIAPYRGALGTVTSRSVESAEYRGSIPNLQSGEYVVLKYKTSFKNKPDSHEEITAQKEYGVWRSLGYYIR